MAKKPKQADSDAWKLTKRNLSNKIGKTFKDGTYKLVEVHDKGIVLERVATGKQVRVSRSLIERTHATLTSGEELAFREISYTVAIEYGVLLALDGFIVADEERRRYSGRDRVRVPSRRRPRDDGKFSGLALGILPWLLMVAAA